MSEYWYPQGAISSEAELSRLLVKAKKKPITIWLVRPVTSDFIMNPVALQLDKGTKLETRGLSSRDDKEYTLRDSFSHWSFWSPLGEACFPYGPVRETDPKTMAYLFLNYWMAYGHALRTGVLRLEGDSLK